MVKNMKCIGLADQELMVEEHNLLSAAYKNVISTCCKSWQIVSSIEQKEESKAKEAQVSMIKVYCEKIETQLLIIFQDVLEVLSRDLIPSVALGKLKVFYLKMWVCTYLTLCSMLTPSFI